LVHYDGKEQSADSRIVKLVLLIDAHDYGFLQQRLYMLSVTIWLMLLRFLAKGLYMYCFWVCSEISNSLGRSFAVPWFISALSSVVFVAKSSTALLADYCARAVLLNREIVCIRIVSIYD
jgi:hypothetical protein